MNTDKHGYIPGNAEPQLGINLPRNYESLVMNDELENNSELANGAREIWG